ncbi:transcription factor TGAL1 [Brachypodium distachyon]|uniref:DOG1 domain-containing protein n=1 Tax=Brachypodium distachyon TaxID=15368 RepID=I1HI58_BRADI|nr:transcription factor TGAL1 [Brachypodium distachyon]XP_024315515.1 transcription factor TGAL1 [Brachypodium distachyon]KQK05643.1 hypothetical protein BRADI_2g21380v3 [Brachypodium distachyon]|eukprot:XP_024315514.1 transcription factor TGAL1 [Brachypodium distachyon]
MDYASPGGTDTSTDPGIAKKNQMTLRRLAQNRDAARKSRLRKKAYVQKLESSSLKLAQLEQELLRARQQGYVTSTLGEQPHPANGNGALALDVEYGRWLEEHNKQIDELRAAISARATDGDLHAIVENIMAHVDEIFRLKSVATKANAFHVLAGAWTTPVERCFLWLSGFRPSELPKLLASQLEPLTEKQLASICSLRQSSQQAEDTLSRDMEVLLQSAAEIVASGTSPTWYPAGSSGDTGQMSAAIGKLGAVESLLQQADELRLRILRDVQRILTTRQSARALLAISGYFSRLRALSSLWIARPSTGMN